MEQPRRAQLESPADSSAEDPHATRHGGGSEDILVRNHDQQSGYDLSIAIVDADSDIVFEKRYYLQPGCVETEFDAVPGGEYVIEATLDSLKKESRQCRIDDRPAHGVFIEIGNGALSVTEGLNA